MNSSPNIEQGAEVKDKGSSLWIDFSLPFSRWTVLGGTWKFIRGPGGPQGHRPEQPSESHSLTESLLSCLLCPALSLLFLSHSPNVYTQVLVCGSASLKKPAKTGSRLHCKVKDLASTSVFADKEDDTQEGDSVVPSHTDSRGRDGARSQAPGLTQLRKHE